MNKLILSFQQFFRENSEFWIIRFKYREASPQLLLQAFLQRIINGGGQITREYGLGMGRTDLFVLWKLPDGKTRRFVLECKIQYGSHEATIKKGIEQVLGYADRCNADEIYLIIFDRSENKSWDDKIFTDTAGEDGKSIRIFGM